MAIGEEEARVVDVEQWAEVRRMHRVDGLSGREISRRTGLHRDTVARLLAATEPPRYEREPAGSKLDPFKEWICEQLRADPTNAAWGRQVEALYALASETWTGIQGLRARLWGGPSLIYFDRRLAQPEARQRLLGLGFEAAGGTPGNLAKFEQQERSKWAPLIKAAGLKGD